MTHLFLNGLAASAGGGLTYLRNVIPHLAVRNDVEVTVAVSPDLRRELEEQHNISFLDVEITSARSRFWHEQTVLPELCRRSGAQVLISAGNFALRKSPVPQILLSRNSLYTSSDFYRDICRRRHYALWFDTRLKAVVAKRSIRWADCTVAPSEAFADELRQWSGAKVVAIHHGFDHDVFFAHHAPLSAVMQQKFDEASDSLRLLFVSHYNYYRNFETLLRAIPILRKHLGGRKVRLFLTCKLRSKANPGSYDAVAASALVREFGISEEVVELGEVPYHLLHQVYRRCSMYLTAAYAESFAHPLVEAMASGLPVVASDLPVHREICGDTARYFYRFSPEQLAEQVLALTNSETLVRDMKKMGLRRSLEFSWRQHADQIISLARTLLSSAKTRNRTT